MQDTDPDCRRLIWVPDEPQAARYLLKCDAVDCCKEDQEGDQIEFQIPNVSLLAKKRRRRRRREREREREREKKSNTEDGAEAGTQEQPKQTD